MTLYIALHVKSPTYPRAPEPQIKLEQKSSGGWGRQCCRYGYWGAAPATESHMEQHVDGPPEEGPAVLLRQVRETSTAYQHDCREPGFVLQTHRPGRSPNFNRSVQE